MGNNRTINVALSQQENRGPNRLMGLEKIDAETAKTRERATPERAMIPSNEFIYIERKERAEEQEPWTGRHARSGRQRCGPHRRATHGQKAGNGEETRQEGESSNIYPEILHMIAAFS